MRQAEQESGPVMSDIDSWSKAVELTAEFCRRSARVSHLLEGVPRQWDSGRRRACQSLLFGTVRHLGLLEKVLDEFLQRRPKKKIWAGLLVASWELYDCPEKKAVVVHNAVEKIGGFAGKSGRGLANAVLRKVATRLEEVKASEPRGASELAWRYSHPEWMVRRWIDQFGESETVAFLQWNQSEAGVYARWQRNPEDVECLSPIANSDGFYRMLPGAWAQIEPFVASGRLYVQNPAAGLAPQLLLDAVGEGRLLDLCAAPGGKALYLEAKSPPDVEEIISLDLAGPRFELMQGNFNRYGAKRVRAQVGNLLEVPEDDLGVFQGVLLDVPCSNSGVMQHKIDVKWRLGERQRTELLQLQQELLAGASRYVADGGFLVYSTCSVDADENREQVDRFLASELGKPFRLNEVVQSLPWESGFDGAGASILARLA